MTHSIEIHIDEMSTLEAVAWIEAITEKFGAEFVCEWAEDPEESEQYDADKATTTAVTLKEFTKRMRSYWEELEEIEAYKRVMGDHL